MQEVRSSASDASHASSALSSTHRDSLTHDAIPLGASMWLDDMGPPSASASASGASASSSLEDSLQLLNSHGGAHAALSFDEDDSVHALFPMLSEASFDYDDDNHHSKTPADQTLDSAAFPTDLSPILTAIPMPKALERKPVDAIAPRKKTPSPRPTTAVETVIPFPVEAARALAVQTSSLPPPSPLAGRKRRRLRSTSLTASLSHWAEHDQNVFFSVLKAKWPTTNPPTHDFATLLVTRFNTISNKLKATSQKTTHDAQAFFETVVHNITELLEAVAPHDIDLLNADETRIALRCWHKLMSDDQKRGEISQLDEATEPQKKRLATELRQSIVRSRRQMRKSTKTTAPLAVDAGLTVADLPETTMEEEEEMKNLEGLLREALEHSSLPSYLYQLAPPLEANATPVVHHPKVRRKSTESSASGSAAATPTSSSLKRKRSESVELYHAFTNGTPLQSLTSISENTAVTPQREAPSFVTPPVRNSTKKIKQDLQTPPQSSRKKIYIKLRMVPRDTQTKDMVERCGCNPKVELKLSSSKKVSDVLDHMAKKWASVKTLVDTHATLHFFQKESSSSSPDLAPAGSTNPREQKPSNQTWSRRNHDVTCLDMWKQVGKMKNDEYIAVVSYQWCVDEVESTKSEKNDSSLAAWMDDSTPLLDLLGDDPRETQQHLAFELEGHISSGDSSKENSPFTSPIHDNLHAQLAAAAQVQPFGGVTSTKQSLQEFSESVAFNTKPSNDEDEDDDEQLSLASLPEDALSELMEYSPNSQRMRRRRIKPMLVATNECQI